MKLVLFGSIPTATSCLRVLVSNFEKENIYVVTDKDYQTNYGETVLEFCKKEKLNTYSLNEIENSDYSFEYGFSIRYNKIFSGDIIKKFKNGIINFHGGPLPKYRGSANHIFAILNEEKRFGPTFHYIDEGIDTGNIIASKFFDISDLDTGYDIFIRTLEIGKTIFEKIINKISLGEYINSIPQDILEGSTYKVKDLVKYQFLSSLDIDEKELIKRLRAFYHPKKPGIILEVLEQRIEMKLVK